LSWNVKGLSHPVKRKGVLAHLRQLKAEVAFLQETHLRAADHNHLNCGWMGQIFHSSFQARARGVPILINKNVPFVPNNIISDKNGWYIIVVGTLCNKNVTLANCYAPDFDDVSFLKHTLSLIPDLNSHSLILGKDFNCCLDPVLDRSSSRPCTANKSSIFLNSYFTEYGISDVWRHLYPQKREYSFFFFSNVHHSYSRIDYFILDNNLISRV